MKSLQNLIKVKNKTLSWQDISVCDKQHPRADKNTQHVFDEQHTRAGQNTQPSTKSKKLIK